MFRDATTNRRLAPRPRWQQSPARGICGSCRGTLARARADPASSPFVAFRVDGLDAEAIESQAMALEQREHQPLPGLVPAQEHAHPLGGLEGPARLSERLAHDPLRVLADALRIARDLGQRARQLVEREHLLALSIAQRTADDLPRDP